MSQIKKVLMAILIILASAIIGCGIAIGSTEDKLLKTSNLVVGGTYNKSGNILCDYKNVLCIDHTSSLSFRKNYKFEVRNIINIVGNTSTGQKGTSGKEYTSKANGVLAYLLSEYKTKIGYVNAHADNEVQLDLWRYINTWKSEIGDRYSGLSDMRMSGGSSYTGKTSEKIKEAKKYANEIESKEKIKDNTDKGNVTTSIFIDEEGKKYLKVGPFNWVFSGKIDEIHVESEVMKKDTNARILTYKDKEAQFGKNNIQSGKNFYVLVKVDEFEGLSGKVALSATQKVEVKTATIYFLQNTSGEQNLMVYKNKSTEKNVNVNYKYEPQYTTIKIEKYKDGTDKTIKGAEFGLYKKGEDGELHQVTKSEKTNENGVIKFKNIPIDNYVLKEIEPASGYKINGSAEVTIGTETKTYKDLENIKVKLKKAIEENKKYKKDPSAGVNIKIYNKTEEKEDGNIKIIKKDTSTKQVLQGAEFIVQNVNTGKYIIASYDKEQEVYIYEKEGEASKFTTDETGEIGINNVPIGEYKIIETKTPDPAIYPSTVTKNVKVKKGNAPKNEFIIYNDKEERKEDGDIEIIKRDSSTRQLLEGAEFIVQNVSTGKYIVADYDNEKQAHIYNREDNTATTFKTDKLGQIYINKVPIGEYMIIETKTPEPTIYPTKVTQRVDVRKGNTSNNQFTIYNDRDGIKEKGDMEIIKRDSSTNQLLEGAEFIIQNVNTGKYIVADYNNEKQSYIYNREDGVASTFRTGQLGQIWILNVPVGEYIIIETRTPDPTIYPITVTQRATVQAGSMAYNMFTMYNDKTPPPDEEEVDISGYVWEDLADGKNNLYNNLYYKKGETYGDGQVSEDLTISGVTVQLIDRTTNNVAINKSGNPCTTVTGEDGQYKFTGIGKDHLANYYVSFTYDGLKYQSISYENNTYLNMPNSSKASEETNNRKEFNNQFAEIAGTEKLEENRGYAISSNGNKSELTYDTTTEEHKAIFNGYGRYTITATTQNSGYNLSEYYVTGSKEITNINLGVYRRQEADIAIVSDIDNVKVSINGYEHTYEYKKREEYIYEEDDEFKDIEKDGFNVGVKFGTEAYNTTYERAVYQTDYEYNAENASNNLAVSVTYLITLKNQTSELVETVNELANYASKTYGNITSSKVKYTNDGKMVENDINWKETNKYGNTYSDENYIAHYADLSGIQIQPNKIIRVYVTYDLSKEDIRKIVTDNTTESENQLLNNISEVNSYSSYKNNEIYAAIDKDSAPGNIVNTENLLNNKSTGEDDTDLAPGLKLVLANARTIKGTVFEDKSELKADKTRNGNGIYENGETGIEGIKVVMKGNENGTGKEIQYETTTVADGNFEIVGFIPGDYTVTYMWGSKYNSTYNVVDYKGTIYVNEDRQNAMDWYKKDVETRYSDAMDNYAKRLEIDKKTEQVTVQTDVNKIKQEEEMDSTTPQFKINVEYEDNELQTTSTGDRFTYSIENVDFGIVERPIQRIDITKRISNITITLENGTGLVNTKVNRILNADGTETVTLEGETSGVKYLPASVATPNEEFNIELDNEVIYGSTLNITYEMIATNKGEKDYLSEKYYKYGNIEGELIKITPTTLIDYVDNDIAFDGNVNSAWTLINRDELKNLVKNELVTAIDGTDGELAKYNTVIKTESLNTALAPEEKVSTTLVVSKLLAVDDSLKYDNNVELVVYGKNGGRTTEALPGNYNPIDLTTKEVDSDVSEAVIITSPTGGEDYIYQYIIVGFACLTILGAGIVIIKRVVL